MAQPIPANQRIESMDALRGVAVLGILAVNVQSFALPLDDMSNPFGGGYRGPLDAVVYACVSVFAQGKFMSLFALLFGAGVALVLDRRRERNEPAAPLHFTRLGWLAGLGFIHGVFIWYGDILLPYALCGMLLYPLLLIPPRLLGKVTLIAWGVALLATSGFGALTYLFESMSDTGDSSAALFANEVELMRGGFLSVMKVRFVTWLVYMILFPFLALPWVTALMLTGALAWRGGWVTGRRSSADYRWLLVFGLLVGLPVAGLRTALSFLGDPALAMALWTPMNLIDGAAGAAAWGAAVMLACRLDAIARLRHVFAAVGRMALTNYLAQSVICTTLFYGTGLGWFGHLSLTELLLTAAAIWLAQLVWSPLWLARFERGPLESLWRCLTYGHRGARSQ